MTGGSGHDAVGFERVYDIVGGHGWFQWRLLLIISIQLIITTWHHIGYSFLGAVPDHWCHIEGLDATNWTDYEKRRISIPKSLNPDGPEYDECHYYNLNYDEIVYRSNSSFATAYTMTSHDDIEVIPCEKWTFDKAIYQNTVPSEFELVCGRRWMTATIQASYMIGGMVGTLISGTVSDKFLGRRKTILLSLAVVTVCGIGAAFATSYWIFLLLRFFISIGVTGSMSNCFVLMMEHADLEYRAALGLIEQIPFAIGYMILPGLAYVLRDWHYLQLSFGLLSISGISYYWLIPDSPRWLATQGEEDRAVEYLIKMAKVNKRPEPTVASLLEIVRPCYHAPRKVKRESIHTLNRQQKLELRVRQLLGNFSKLVQTAEVRRRSFVFWTLFSTVAMTYYGLVFASNLTRDPYLLVFLGGLMEIPAYTLIVPFVSKLGRRPTTLVTFIISGICLVGLSFLDPSREGLRMTLAMTAKLFISAAFGIIYVLGAELYPTEMRTTGLAVGIFCGRIGSAIAPYISDLLQYAGKDIPLLIFGVTACIAGVVSLGLPETAVLEMADQVQEVEKQGTEIRDNAKRRMSLIDGITAM